MGHDKNENDCVEHAFMFGIEVSHYKRDLTILAAICRQDGHKYRRRMDAAREGDDE